LVSFVIAHSQDDAHHCNNESSTPAPGRVDGIDKNETETPAPAILANWFLLLRQSTGCIPVEFAKPGRAIRFGGQGWRSQNTSVQPPSHTTNMETRQ
jgi:hypothetical protein